MRKTKKTNRKLTKNKDGKNSKGVPAHKTPWEIASRLMAKLPEEAWKNCPSDLSINVDHYLYGAPRIGMP
jgi:hypothetical protein